MTKQQRKEIDDLYNFSNNTVKKEKEEKKKAKEREKRIKQRKNEQKDQFDFDTEMVIGMTNKNNKKIQQKNQARMTKKQAKIIKLETTGSNLPLKTLGLRGGFVKKNV